MKTLKINLEKLIEQYGMDPLTTAVQLDPDEGALVLLETKLV